MAAPITGIFPIRGGRALMQNLTIKKVTLPPFLPSGLPIKLPVTLNSTAQFRNRTILIRVIDTLPDGSVIEIGNLQDQIPPGEKEFKVPITVPDVIGMDKIRVEALVLVLGVFPRLHDVFETDIEKQKLPGVTQMQG